MCIGASSVVDNNSTIHVMVQIATEWVMNKLFKTMLCTLLCDYMLSRVLIYAVSLVAKEDTHQQNARK